MGGVQRHPAGHRPRLAEDAHRFSGPSTYGLVIAVFSLSGLIGTIVVGRIRLKRPGTSAMVFNALFTTVPLVLLSPFSLWWVVAGYMIAGFAMMPFDTRLHTALQRQSPVGPRPGPDPWRC